MQLIKINKIFDASIKISNLVKKTKYQKTDFFSNLYQSNIFLKREDNQLVKSFKIRGAYNKILSLNEFELKKGLVCASAGNHAQGFALACSHMMCKGTVYMPKTTPKLKVERVSYFGKNFIDINLYGKNFADAHYQAELYCKKYDKKFIHPYNDLKIIEGQATLFLEIINQIDFKIDYLIVPIGGGGLLSGAINVFKQLSKSTIIVGVQVKGAPAMKNSLESGKLVKLDKVDNFVDGAVVKQVGNITYSFCKSYLDDIVVVDEDEICYNMTLLSKYDKINAEPAGAMSIAALRTMNKKIKNKNIMCLICGGNNDPSRLTEILKKSKNWISKMKNNYINPN